MTHIQLTTIANLGAWSARPARCNLLLVLLLLPSLLLHHWLLYWTVLAARSLHWTIIAVSLDATVYFVAHCTNFNVTTGGAGADYIIETHHWFMEEMRETDTGEDWNGQSDCYCYY